MLTFRRRRKWLGTTPPDPPPPDSPPPSPPPSKVSESSQLPAPDPRPTFRAVIMDAIQDGPRTVRFGYILMLFGFILVLCQPVPDARARDARIALDMRPELREGLRDGVVGNGKVIDVLLPRPVEAAAEQKPRIVVDECNPGFMYRAELFGVLYSAGISRSPLDSLAQRLFVARLDLPNDGKFCPGP